MAAALEYLHRLYPVITAADSSSSFTSLLFRLHAHLTDDQGVVIREVVRWDLQIQRRRALSDTARDVVVGTVTWAEPAAEITCLADGHTTQVGADTQHDEPLRLLDAVLIGLRVAQLLPVDLLGLGNLVGGSVADEDGLPTPLDDDILALRNGSQVDFDLGLREHVGRGGHVHEEVYETKFRVNECFRAIFTAIDARSIYLSCTYSGLCPSPANKSVWVGMLNSFFGILTPKAEIPPRDPTMKYWKTLLLVSLPPR